MKRSDPRVRELCATVAVLMLALVGAFAPDAYLPMLFRAFIVPVSVAVLALAGLAALRKRWWLAQGALLGAGMMLLQLPATPASTRTGASPVVLRIFHMNVLQPNTAFDGAIAQALASDADVISVQEVSPEWAVALRCGLGESHPYAYIEPRTNCYGIALFSRRPLTGTCLLDVEGAPFIEARMDVDGRPVRLLAVHATSPITYGHFRRRNAQLDQLGAYLAQDDTATIVVGDLNTVPWDGAYGRFCARAGLRSTTARFQRTWPSVGPFAAIPLDHVLVSPGIASSALRTVHIPGSDHKGLLAELSF